MAVTIKIGVQFQSMIHDCTEQTVPPLMKTFALSRKIKLPDVPLRKNTDTASTVQVHFILNINLDNGYFEKSDVNNAEMFIQKLLPLKNTLSTILHPLFKVE